MKANNILFALSVGSMLMAGSVAAAGAGSGKVTFSGEIINAPCSVAPESVDQVVNLGQVSTRQLANGGESNPQPFSIKLRNCDLTPTTSNVTVSFSGPADPAENTLLAITGQARGAGIKVTAPGGATVVWGTPTAAYALTNGDNDLLFSAVLKGYASQANTPLVAGNFTAVTNFTLAYQ